MAPCTSMKVGFGTSAHGSFQISANRTKKFLLCTLLNLEPQTRHRNTSISRDYCKRAPHTHTLPRSLPPSTQTRTHKTYGRLERGDRDEAKAIFPSDLDAKFLQFSILNDGICDSIVHTKEDRLRHTSFSCRVHHLRNTDNPVSLESKIAHLQSSGQVSSQALCKII